MAFGNIPKDAGGIPIGVGYVYGDAFYALQAGRKLTDGSSNALATLMAAPTDGLALTYSASVVGLVPVTAATHIVTLTGSATKTVKLTRISVTMSATLATAPVVPLAFLKLSSALTGGTAASMTMTAHDSGPATPATALAQSWTANSSGGGALVGAIRNYRIMPQLTPLTATDFPQAIPYVEDFGIRPSQCPVLRGVAQVLSLNLNGLATVTGWLFDISIEWTEDNS